MYNVGTILASFTEPMQLSNTWTQFLWLLPLVTIIAIVYKSIKLPQITAYKMVREVIVLAGTIIIFMTLIAFGLFAVMKVVMG